MVCDGRMNPQPPGAVDGHETLHATPPGGVLSFATLALTDTCDCAACVVAAMDEGGACVKAIVGDGEVMTTTTDAGLDAVVDGSLDPAVIVTNPPVGIVFGGVYIVAFPVVVDVLVKLPQSELPQVAFQVMLPSAGVSVATNVIAPPPDVRVAGGAVVNFTAITVEVVNVPCAVAVFVGSALDVAVMAMVLPLAMAFDPLNVAVATPFFAVPGVKFAVAHAVVPLTMQLHVTPRFAVSFVTVAVSGMERVDVPVGVA